LIGIIIGVLGVTLVPTHFIQNLPWNKPKAPNIVFSQSPNQIINNASSASISITVTPLFMPPWSVPIDITIPNNNSSKTYMVVEFKTPNGFKFMPVINAPVNISFDEGYAYTDTIKVNITDIPPFNNPQLSLTVYTLDSATYGTKPSITYKVLAEFYQ
jgi:hypothetical protein